MAGRKYDHVTTDDYSVLVSTPTTGNQSEQSIDDEVEPFVFSQDFYDEKDPWTTYLLESLVDLSLNYGFFK